MSWLQNTFRGLLFKNVAFNLTIQELKDREENREKYGVLRNQNETESPARAMISGLFDVFNKFFLDLQICNIHESEVDAAEKNLEAIRRNYS